MFHILIGAEVMKNKHLMGGVIVLCCVLLMQGLQAQEIANYGIKSLTQKDGLSSSKVYSLLQDHQGFVWIGTDEGVNRYDGHRIETFCLTSACDGKSDEVFVRYLFEDSRQRLWIATNTGLFQMSPDRRSVQRYNLEDVDGDSYDVSSLSEDASGTLWIGCRKGLYQYAAGGSDRTLQKYDAQNPALRNISFIQRVEEDLWIGSWTTGVYHLEGRTGQFTDVNEAVDRPAAVPALASPITLAEGPDGSIWIGCYGHGLYNLTKDIQFKRFFQHDDNDPESINGNKIKSLAFDQKGYLWIGTEEAGIDRLAPAEGKFTHFLSSFQDQGAYEGYSIYSSFVDQQDQLWLGFRNDGIQIVPLNDPLFASYPLKNFPEGEQVISGLHASREALWVGVKGGLVRRSTHSEHEDFARLPNGESPLAIYELLNGKVLTGTITGNIFLYNPQQRSFQQFLSSEDQTLLKGKKVNSFYEYAPDKVIVGTQAGTYLIELSNPRLTMIADVWTHSILPDPDEFIWLVSFSRDPIQYFPSTGKAIQHQPAVDGDLKAAVYLGQTLYIGTDLGFFSYDPKTRATKHHTDIFPFLNMQVNAMVADDQRNIWFSSTDAIVHYNPTNELFRTFDTFDGVSPNRFRDEMSARVSNGRLVFGGNNGLQEIDPSRFVQDEPKRPVTFTNLVFNQSRREDMHLAGNHTNQLVELQHTQRTLTVQFSLLSFRNPDKHRYQYQLSESGDTWIDLGNQAEVNLINLPAGEHTLSVRATDDNGIWSAPSILTMKVYPPLLLRWYFIALYALAFFAVVATIFRLRSRQLRLEKDYAVEHIKSENIKEKSEREAEFHNMRLMFFTNISHEFRTPLTLILAPLEKFIQKGIEPSPEHLQLMYRNAERLRRLIGQILDFRKMESNQLKFDPTFGDIVKFTNECGKLFEAMANQKRVALKMDTPAKGQLLWFDRDKYEKIIINLLSNAFKFTNDGQVLLQMTSEDDSHGDTSKIKIVVEDTGTGIHPEHLPKIFDRFYHVKNKNSDQTNGTGIGLALVKELVELHNGQIWVESVKGQGTRFTVELNLDNSHQVDQTPDSDGVDAGEVNLLFDTTEQTPLPQEALEEEQGYLPTLLIVEDDVDLREFVRVEFSNTYKVVEAENGNQGFKAAIKHVPDIILSDISMPEVDGLEMTERLKKDERTNHIPIILLTAHGSTLHQRKGFEIGVEDFIVKPFSSEILEIRINNLLQSRQELQNRFQKEFKVEPHGLPTTSMDQAFLDRAMNVIQENLNNADFSATQFAEEMCMSRVHLYRKLKALTNESVSGFVKIVR
ncbi:MAG: ATP-binding protein, partial [Bacteroidota bacterium]